MLAGIDCHVDATLADVSPRADALEMNKKHAVFAHHETSRRNAQNYAWGIQEERSHSLNSGDALHDKKHYPEEEHSVIPRE